MVVEFFTDWIGHASPRVLLAAAGCVVALAAFGLSALCRLGE